MNDPSRGWRRRALLAAYLAAGLALFAEGAFLFVVSRPAFRAWLTAELQKGGASVKFGAVGGWPLRVRLDDVGFEGPAMSSYRTLRAPHAYATLEWGPLLREQRLVLDSVTLDGAEVSVRLADGAPEQIALPLPVGQLRLRGSSLRVSNLSGWTALLRGVDASLRQEGSGPTLAVTASIESAAASIEGLVLESVEADVRLSQGRLAVASSTARLSRGTLTAAGSLRLGPPAALESLQVHATGADVRMLLKAMGWSDRFGGSVTLDASCSGRLTPSVRELSGEGRVQLERFSAQVNLPKVNLFNIAPTLKELRKVEGLTGGFAFRLDGPRVQASDLTLRNVDLQVSGSGGLTLFGALSFRCRSVLSPRFARGLPGMVTSSLEASEAGGVAVPFRLEGTLAEPEANVDAVMKGALLRPFRKIF